MFLSPLRHLYKGTKVAFSQQSRCDVWQPRFVTAMIFRCSRVVARSGKVHRAVKRPRVMFYGGFSDDAVVRRG